YRLFCFKILLLFGNLSVPVSDNKPYHSKETTQDDHEEPWCAPERCLYRKPECLFRRKPIHVVDASLKQDFEIARWKLSDPQVTVVAMRNPVIVQSRNFIPVTHLFGIIEIGTYKVHLEGSLSIIEHSNLTGNISNGIDHSVSDRFNKYTQIVLCTGKCEWIQIIQPIDTPKKQRPVRSTEVAVSVKSIAL